MSNEIENPTADDLEYRAAKMLDKVTHRGPWSGEPSEEAVRLVNLLIGAAVERIEERAREQAACEPTAATMDDAVAGPVLIWCLLCRARVENPPVPHDCAVEARIRQIVREELDARARYPVVEMGVEG